jgi:two-component system response regulator FixJ
VVDCDLAVRESLKFALELEGLVVRLCGSGAELLRHPDLRQAGCLVMVCKMPLMDGFEVLDILAIRGAKLPVVLLTSYATDAFRRRAAASGVKFILEKPLLNGSLVDRIREVLGCSRQVALVEPIALRRIPEDLNQFTVRAGIVSNENIL